MFVTRERLFAHPVQTRCNTATHTHTHTPHTHTAHTHTHHTHTHHTPTRTHIQHTHTHHTHIPRTHTTHTHTHPARYVTTVRIGANSARYRIPKEGTVPTQ